VLNESFTYRDGNLWCDGVSLDQIADATGTPVYVYSAARILANVRRLQEAFVGASIHYSLKANANLALIRLLRDQGLGMDAVSAGEIFRACKAGVEPQHIVFAGVGKTRAEITYALEMGVGWFNVESLDELRQLDTLAGENNRTPSVALRLNPGIEAKTHRHISTGHYGAKFGIPLDIAGEILAHCDQYPHLHITGLHLHIGSQLGDIKETILAVMSARELAESYPEIHTLNIGGGFPVRYIESDPYHGPRSFAVALEPLLKGFDVKIEPGRFIVADAGIMLLSVLYIKEQGGHRFVITDGSMTDLIRPALYEAVHSIIPLRDYSEMPQSAIVVGPVCESTDVLNRNAMLPALTAGDRLAVMVTGAYGMVMASNYNMRTRAPEVLVESDTWRIIRRRETWDDLLRQEETL
jgi:diaminopimelate decarboxylase